MYCVHCGNQTSEVAKFCHRCGASTAGVPRERRQPISRNCPNCRRSRPSSEPRCPCGFDFSLPAAPQVEALRLRGVRGWLLLLTASIGVANPVLSSTVVLTVLGGDRSPFEKIVLATLWIAFATASVVVGLRLWQRERQAPRWTQIFLVINFGFAFAVTGLDGASGNSDASAFVLQVAGAGLFCFGWRRYLQRSRRVRYTYQPDCFAATPVDTRSVAQPLTVDDRLAVNDQAAQSGDSSGPRAATLEEQEQGDVSAIRSAASGVDPAAQAAGDLQAPSPNSVARMNQQSRGYWLRHWRGDYRLPIAYWVNGTLVGGSLAAFVWAVGQSLDFSAAPRSSALVSIALWAATFAVTAWQVVGIWRSATHYRTSGGSAGWATAAQVAVVLGVLQVAAVGVTQAVPQVVEFGTMALGRDPFNHYQLRVLRDASELEIAGYIAFGLTADVEKTLDAHPTVRLIHLNSNGGRVAEARKLRDLIAGRKLTTYTAAQCLSACVICFMAGEQRLADPSAKIGFHRYSFPGLTEQQVTQGMLLDREYFVARGVDEAFLERVFSSDQLTCPPVEELLRHRVITGAPDSGQVALTGYALSDITALDGQLRKQKPYGALAQYDAASYQQVLGQIQDGLRRGVSLVELRTRTLPIISESYVRALPFASDEVVLQYVQLMLDQMAALYKSSPAKCYQLLFEPTALIPARDLSAELVVREQTVMADVLSSASVAAHPVPTEAEISGTQAAVISQMVTRHGSKVRLLSDTAAGRNDPAAVCVITYDMYSTIVGLPPEQAVPLLRFMLK
jgi:hypothetical protein